MPVHLIFNPAAKSGKIRKFIPQLEELMNLHFGTAWELQATQKTGDATDFTRKAIRENARLIIAAGGDGTVHEVVNGFFHKGQLINGNCELGILNFGTGHDFSRSLNLPKSLEAQFEVLKGSAQPVDVGSISFQTKDGNRKSAYFINECQAGIGGIVAQKVHKGHKRLGGKLAFGWVSLQQALLGKANSIEVQIDGRSSIQQELLALVMANGAYMGAGMQTTPNASIQDGKLDILFIQNMSLLQRLLNFPKIYSGTHLKSRFIHLERGQKVVVSSTEKVPIEADGEFLGYLACEVELLKAALKVKF